MSTKVNLNRASIAKTVSTNLGIGGKLTGFAAGLVAVGDYTPENSSEYHQFRRLMHDVLCDGLIDSGHFQNQSFQIGKLGLFSENKKLSQQKPDLYSLQGNNLMIGEVTLTYNAIESMKEKKSKYDELFDFLMTNGYDVVYNVILVDITDAEWSDSIPSISGLHMQIIQDFIDNLRIIHNNPKFANLRTTSKNFVIDTFAFKLEDETLIEEVYKATGVKVSAEEIKGRLMMGSKQQLTDEEYISRIAQSIIDNPMQNRPIPAPEEVVPVDLVKDWESYKSIKANTEKLPNILQLGCAQVLIEDAEETSVDMLVELLRKTKHHGGYLDLIKSSLQRETPDEKHMITLSLSEDQLHHEQLQGPGKKQLMKKMGMKIPREAPRHIGVKEAHEYILNDLIGKINETVVDFRLNEHKMPGLDTMGVTSYVRMSEILDDLNQNPTTAITKFYQRISAEIIINSMRRRKSRQYVLCNSGFKNIFFLVAPGPQLRTENNTEFIKIISFVPPITHELSANWELIGDHWESKWLSVDTDRLKHWQRASDRSLLSFIGTCEKLVDPETTLKNAIKSEIRFGNYTFLSLTYLEDKKLTSITNQTIRYVWMKALGDKQFRGIMSKFPERVNSVIQSCMMQRMMKFAIEVCSTKLSDLIQGHQSIRDEETGHYDETTTGVVGSLPRLVTLGGRVPPQYNLNEIYYCMAYNKDRQNQAQDALSILSKIKKEELKYDKELASREGKADKVSYLLGNTSVEQDVNHIHSKSPESHYFSYRAVLAGIRLQDSHFDNVGNQGTWKTSEKISAILNKNLSEFATFKASVKTICEHIDKNDLSEVKKIGSRTKAIELVAEIVQNEKLQTSMDVAMQYSGTKNQNFEVLIQLFKKAQIGGTREIIILFIKARIIFNIMEEIARILSKSDKREILTKGRDKRLMMRGDYEDVMSNFKRGTPVKIIKESYDMATWCQKFIPSIFIPMYEVHFADYQPMLDLARFLFLKHCNKKMEYPSKLVEQWMKHPTVQHEEPAMQQAKEEFLSSGVPYFVNHSNMCQGIPHYNSTVLALSVLSFRDALFDSCLKLLGQVKKIHWKSRAGSDDKGTIIGVDMSDEDSYKQYLLLGQCELAAERLHSQELSVKSSSGNLIYELNSAFMINLETLAPVIKFTMAACDVIGTTSCTSFVNESFTRIRQLRENGGSSFLCGLAHILNKSHFETIFAVGLGMENEPSNIFEEPNTSIPYDFGVYPFYDIDLQDIVGPEFYNYKILKEAPLTSKPICALYKQIGLEEEASLVPNDEDSLFKKDHFGIYQGLVKQLKNMRARLKCNPEEINKFLESNPFMMIRGPETLEETRMAILSKLFTKGASESLRRTSPAIYIGRLSAFRTARAWSVLKETEATHLNLRTGELTPIMGKEFVTYREFLKTCIEKIDPILERGKLSEMMKIMYPQWQSFEVLDQFIGKFGPLSKSNKKHSQAVRHWVANNFNYEFTSSLKSILETCFGVSQLSSKEDVGEFRKLLNLKSESLDEFVKECEAKRLRPLDLFFYMNKIYKSTRKSRIQTFAFGPSTNSLHMTALAIKRFNHYPGSTMFLEEGVDEVTNEQTQNISTKIDQLKLFTNFEIMSLLGLLEGGTSLPNETKMGDATLLSSCETIVRSIKSLAGFDYVTQKILKFVASRVLSTSEFKDKITSWKTLNFSYIRRQKKDIKPSGHINWSGDLEILVNSGVDCFTFHETSGSRYLRTNMIRDLSQLLLTIRDICRVLGFESKTLFTNRQVKVGEIFLSNSTKQLLIAEVPGVVVPVLKLRIDKNFKHRRLQDFDTFTIRTLVSKSKAIEVQMVDNNNLSATICHFPGTLFPVHIPKSVLIPNNYWYLGLRLSSILKNKDWFFNGRLSEMNEHESIKFLEQDVKLETILSLPEQDMENIRDYIEAREEVNEELFNIGQPLDHGSLMPVEVTSIDFTNKESIGEMFKNAMKQAVEEVDFADLLKTEDPIGDWFEHVEEHLDSLRSVEVDFDMLSGADGINFVRSFGYKKPSSRKNQVMIGMLQQGSVIRNKVVNMIFKSGSVMNEDVRRLPYMYAWLEKFDEESTYYGLSIVAKKLITTHLSTSLGIDEHTVTRTLQNRSRVISEPIPRLSVLIGQAPLHELNVFDELLNEVYANKNDYSDSDTE
jgi:hypothetical protein